ncbi:MAG: hypothetical protein WDN67_04230 [Candidatus Moraniibacteriota bacterium]
MFRRIRIIFLLACVFLAWAKGADAKDFNVYGEVTLASSYTDDELSVYTDGPVIQPELVLSHEPSGCYGSIWVSRGLAKSAGDETDFTIGCERDIAKDVTEQQFR